MCYILFLVVDILQELVVQIKTDTSKDSEEEIKADKALEKKTKILYDRNKKLRAQQQEFRRVLDPSYHSKQIKDTSPLLLFFFHLLKFVINFFFNFRKYGSFLGGFEKGC